jgi:hypothetical protein
VPRDKQQIVVDIWQNNNLRKYFIKKKINKKYFLPQIFASSEGFSLLNSMSQSS